MKLRNWEHHSVSINMNFKWFFAPILTISFTVSSFASLFSYFQCMEASSKIVQAYKGSPNCLRVTIQQLLQKIKQKGPFVLDDSDWEITWISHPDISISLSMHHLEAECSKTRQIIKGSLANWQILCNETWQQNISPTIWQLHFGIEN